MKKGKRLSAGVMKLGRTIIKKLHKHMEFPSHLATSLFGTPIKEGFKEIHPSLKLHNFTKNVDANKKNCLKNK